MMSSGLAFFKKPFELSEFIRLSLMARPSFDFSQINLIVFCNQDSLFQALAVIKMLI
jgi:hypothetical protein